MEALSQPMISTDSPECCEELVVRLDILRRNESFCDVKVVVNNKEFAAHRAVLAAASPFFLSLLLSDMRESKEHLIRIELEEATVSVMEDVLQYIYTGNVSVTEENAHNLVATADYLLLPGLKTVVGRYLTDNLETGNCIFYYYFADEYQCEELKEEARDMINSNFSAVIETEDFLSLDIKQVMEWVSSDDITVKTEEEVFKGIVKWVSHKKSEREVDFPGLLHQVRLVSISHDFLLNELVKDELVAKNSVLCLNFVLDAIRLMASATTGQVIQKPRKCLETHMDAIFVCGGKRSLCYFPQQNLWYQLSSMAYHHDFRDSPAQCRDKVYIPCSRSYLPHCPREYLMEFYIPTTNSYSTVQLATTFTCTAVLKGFLYATCDEFSENKGVYRYDPEKNYLNKLKAQPTPRHRTCFVSDAQYLYTIGGTSRGQYMYTTERFDPSANEWERVAPINEPRCAAFGASMNGKVYIAGGEWKNKTLSSCEVYNPVTNEWHLIASLKEPRRCASMVHYEGSLYVLGGFLADQRRTCSRLSESQALSVEIFHSEQSEWEEKTVIPLHYIETSEEEDKEKTIFKACFARLHKGVIDKLKPLNKIASSLDLTVIR